MIESRNILIFVFSCTMVFGKVNAQSLDSLLQLAVENNLELKSLQLEYEAELLKVDQVSQLPDPLIGVGIPVLRPETRLGPQVMMVSASQMFPWFGTLKAKGNVVISMSKAKYERISAVRLEVFNKIKIAYYRLQFIEEKEEVIKEILVQFDALKSISLAKVENGSASAANVLRIQLKLDELNQSINKLQHSKEKFYAEINAITLQPWETIINTKVDDQLPVMSFDVEAYKAKIRAHYPLMLKLDQEIQVSKDKQLVNKKMGAPKFGLGIDYALVSERTDMNPEFNGRDIFVPKVMISIPLYRKSYKAKDAEETLNQNVLELKKEDLETRIIGQILKFKAEYENAMLDLELNKQQIETTNRVYEILLSDYSATGGGFDDLLQIQNQLLGYHLGIANAEMMAWISKSNIDRFTDY